MKVALIAPVSLLPWTLLTDYQLMLPQMLNNPEYRLFYKYLCQDKDQYVILDNGAAEGELAAPEELAKLVEEYQPSELVLPDVLEDGPATVAAVDEFLTQSVPNCRLGIVAAGKTVDESVATAKEILDHHNGYIDVIYVPRSLVKHQTDARLRVASELVQFTDREIHFLGTNPLWMDEAKFASLSKMVRGIDTSAPFNYAWGHAKIDSEKAQHRPELFFDLCSTLFGGKCLEYNIHKLMEWTGNDDLF